MEETRNAYRILLGDLSGKSPLGSPRKRYKNNIKMYLRKMDSKNCRWMEHIQCWAFVLADHILPPWKKPLFSVNWQSPLMFIF
jgi:hypothetical protein